MKVRDTVTLTCDIKVHIAIGTAIFQNDKLVIKKGQKVRIDDIFQGEAKIQQMESPYIHTWIPIEDLQASIE